MHRIDLHNISFNRGRRSNTTATNALDRVVFNLSLLGLPTLVINALLDGGSTHSFISTRINLISLSNANTNDIKSEKLIVQGATGSVESKCFIVNSNIEIGRWSGDHKFLVTESVCKHEAILGRDFF